MTKDNDPWGKEPKIPKNNITDKFGDWISNILKGNNSNRNEPDRDTKNNRPRKASNGFNINPIIILSGIGAVILFWLASGFYIVKEGFSGVELCFGKHQETNTAGLYWNCPKPLGTVFQIDTQRTKTMEINTVKTQAQSSSGTGQMLTADENIVEVSLAVQYRINNPEEFLFKVSNPTQVLQEASVSAIRETVGSNSVDYILIEGREEWSNIVEETLKGIMDSFHTGIQVLRVELRDSKAPDAVQDAFDDAVKAREEAKSYRLQAQAYENERVPLTRGKAINITEKALADGEKIIAEATGEATRFTERLAAYNNYGEEITKDRMYLETLGKVYQNVNNVVIDTDGQMPILYLPVNNEQNQSPAILPIKKQNNTEQENATNTFNTSQLQQIIKTRIPEPLVKENVINNEYRERKKR